MVEIIESPEGTNVVVDTGTNTFAPLMAYLIRDGAFDAICDAGKTPIIQSIVGGGDNLQNAAEGLYLLSESTRVPNVETDVALVVLENWHSGPCDDCGKSLRRNCCIQEVHYRVNARIVGKARPSEAIGNDIRKKDSARLTLNEALEGTAFNVMEENRKRIYGIQQLMQ